jgi:F420-non-reducing hydrogenase iron-sulfur subunit
LGECEFDTGIFYATKATEYLKQVAISMGLEPERIQIAYCSAAEGERFKNTASKMDKKIRELGPSPLRSLAFDNHFKAQERLLKKKNAKKTTAPK